MQTGASCLTFAVLAEVDRGRDANHLLRRVLAVVRLARTSRVGTVHVKSVKERQDVA